MRITPPPGNSECAGSRVGTQVNPCHSYSSPSHASAGPPSQTRGAGLCAAARAALARLGRAGPKNGAPSGSRIGERGLLLAASWRAARDRTYPRLSPGMPVGLPIRPRSFPPVGSPSELEAGARTRLKFRTHDTGTPVPALGRVLSSGVERTSRAADKLELFSMRVQRPRGWFACCSTPLGRRGRTAGPLGPENGGVGWAKALGTRVRLLMRSKGRGACRQNCSPRTRRWTRRAGSRRRPLEGSSGPSEHDSSPGRGLGARRG